MAVYVGVPMWPFGRMLMCHMVADTETELDEMADALGLRRRWKQHNPDLVHYDIAKSKRARAIELGAVPLDTLEAEAEILERLAAG
jgi:Protein of unknown function (DUF4031)